MIPSSRAMAPAAALAALLSGCGTQTATGGEVLRFLTATLPPAATGEPYSQEVVLTAGTRPYQLRVTKGTLPPGLTLQDRRIVGTPTEAKPYTFTLEASDANLSIVNREYALNVTATPPSSLEWTVPPTEVRGEIRVPFLLKAPRNVRAVRAEVRLPAGAALVRVEPGAGRPLLMSRLQDGVLRVDAAVVEPFRNNRNATLFTVVLSSETPVRLVGRVGFDLRAGGRSLATQPLDAAPAAPSAAPGQPGATAPGATPPAQPGTGAPAAAPTEPAPPARPNAPEEPGEGDTHGEGGETETDEPATDEPETEPTEPPAGGNGQ